MEKITNKEAETLVDILSKIFSMVDAIEKMGEEMAAYKKALEEIKTIDLKDRVKELLEDKADVDLVDGLDDKIVDLKDRVEELENADPDIQYRKLAENVDTEELAARILEKLQLQVSITGKRGY